MMCITQRYKVFLFSTSLLLVFTFTPAVALEWTIYGDKPLFQGYDTYIYERTSKRLLHCPESAYSCDNEGSVCSCEPNCFQYGDCCWEMIYNITAVYPKPYSVCHDTGYVGVHMVKGCAHQWPRDDVARSGCEKPQRYNHIYYSTPVTSRRGIVYYNLFCALCNYDTETIEDLDFWIIRNDSGNRVFEPPTQLGVRSCYTQWTITCGIVYLVFTGPGEEDDRQRLEVANAHRDLTLCETFFAPVTSGEGEEYKNIFCALCIDKSDTNFTCSTAQLRGPGRKGSGGCYTKYGCRGTVSQGQREHARHATIKLNRMKKHFAVASPQKEKHLSVREYLTIVCLSVSLLCLVSKVIVYIAYEKARSFASKCVLCLSSTLLFSQLLFLLATSFRLPHPLCMTSEVLIHYGFLATFCWTTVLSYDIWTNTVNRSSSGRREPFLRYCRVSWCTPFFFVLVPIFIDMDAPSSPVAPSYGQGACHTTNALAQVVFFLTPMAVLLVVDCGFYVHVVLYIRRTVKEASNFEFSSRKELSQMGMYVKLALIMGATWILAVFSAFVRSLTTDVIVILLIGLQGVYLFVGFKDYRYVVDSLRAKLASDTVSTEVTIP